MIFTDYGGFRLNIFRFFRRLLIDYELILTSMTSDKKPVKEHKKTLPSKLSLVAITNAMIAVILIR